ncbi:carbonic anhydrase 2 isoform X1 [Hydra vulgaris]|uniref:carbonic anhydrase 2 isoform X1 n=1 Tax=Hydra vulgaris TaxID=6087 RepID=UPI001F5EA799|nr:carbonic anhydrase 2 isoform X1 [Hydra vulgaris]
MVTNLPTYIQEVNTNPQKWDHINSGINFREASLDYFGNIIFSLERAHNDNFCKSRHGRYIISLSPQYWGYDHPICNGKRQSPINIIENQAFYSTAFTPLILFNYSTLFNNTNYYLTNNGHTVILGIDADSSLSIGLFWRGRQYNYYGLHFHWGENDQHGSEHLFSNKANPLEVHILHYLNDYGTFSNSLNYDDGVLVWSNIFQLNNSVDTSSNPLQDIFNNIKNVIHAGDKASIQPVALSSFVAENSTYSYYYYDGSLTTPECSESVVWIVNQKFMKVSSSQLKDFRTLKGHYHNISNLVKEENLLQNDRPTQPFNKRTLYTSVNFINSVTSFSKSYSAAASYILILGETISLFLFFVEF